MRLLISFILIIAPSLIFSQTVINDSSRLRFDIGIGIMNEREDLDRAMVSNDGYYENMLSTDVLMNG